MEIARHIGGLERQRAPELVVGPVESPSRGQHSDHRIRLSIEQNGPTDDVRVGAELRYPERVAQDGNMVLTGLVFIARKSPSLCGLDAEDVKVMRRDQRCAQLCGFAVTGQGGRAAGLRSHIVEDRVVLLPVQKVESRDPVPAASRGLLEHAHDAVGFCVRERLQQHAIDETEDCGIRANADCQGGNRDSGERGAVPQGPQTVAKILGELVHVRALLEAPDQQVRRIKT